jgi:hypothetical protein
MGSRSWNAKLSMSLDRKILASPDRFDDALGMYLSVNVVTVQFFCGGYRRKIRLYWHQNSAVLVSSSALKRPVHPPRLRNKWELVEFWTQS